MGAYIEDTAIEPLGEGRYRGEVSDRWHVLFDIAPNGGYVSTIAARAMAAASARPDPLTLTSHYLRPPRVGPIDIETSIVKAGRRLTTVEASVVQQGHEIVRLLGAFTDLAAADGPTRVDRAPPELPPIEDCFDPNAEDPEGFAPQILRRFDHRMPKGTMDWVAGNPLGRGEITGYCRFQDGDPIDGLALILVADAYPPAVFNAGSVVGWVPTVELTVQIRKRPAPGWLRTRFTTEAVTSGFLEEDGELWDEEGDLVALSRQLALVARPR